MKRIFNTILRAVAVAAGAVVLAAGLQSCNQEEIDDIKGRLDALEAGTIPPVNQQIAEINATLPKLQAMDTELKGFITNLEATATSLQEKLDKTNADLAQAKKDLQDGITAAKQEAVDNLTAAVAALQAQIDTINAAITALQAKDTALEARIDELKAYVDNKDTATRDWVTATYSTLAQYNQTVEEIAAIKASILALETSLTAAYTDAIATAIAASETAMKAWVGEQLTAYWTVAETQAKLDALETAYKAADTAIGNDIASLQTAINTAKTDLTAAYQAAIAEAITTNNGVINQKIATDIATAKADLQAQIDAITARIDALEARIVTLEGQVSGILASVQSIVLVPTFTDGSVLLTGSKKDTVRFEIQPLAAVSKLVELGPAAFSLDAVETLTKADAMLNIPVTGLAVDGPFLAVEVDDSGLPANILSGAQAINARLLISDGTATRSSEFFPLAFTDGNMAETVGSEPLFGAKERLFGKVNLPADVLDNIFLGYAYGECGFQYAESAAALLTNPVWVRNDLGYVDPVERTYSNDLEGTVEGRTYYYRAFVYYNGVVNFGEIKSFVCTNPTVTLTFNVYDGIGWGSLKLYVWNGIEFAGAWPGMDPSEPDVVVNEVTYKSFVITDFPQNTTINYILNNGSGAQTIDLVLDAVNADTTFYLNLKATDNVEVIADPASFTPGA